MNTGRVIIPENLFRETLKSKLSDYFGKFDFVTGPGRSGAVASVYASHFLKIPFVPLGSRIPEGKRVMVIDTVEKTGRTLRKAGRRFPNSVNVSIFGKPDEQYYFWYEFV